MSISIILAVILMYSVTAVVVIGAMLVYDWDIILESYRENRDNNPTISPAFWVIVYAVIVVLVGFTWPLLAMQDFEDNCM